MVKKLEGLRGDRGDRGDGEMGKTRGRSLKNCVGIRGDELKRGRDCKVLLGMLKILLRYLVERRRLISFLGREE